MVRELGVEAPVVAGAASLVTLYRDSTNLCLLTALVSEMIETQKVSYPDLWLSAEPVTPQVLSLLSGLSDSLIIRSQVQSK